MSKVVFITGATAGIGYATAELFLKKGYTVWAVGRRLERLQALKKRFPKQCRIARLDITNKKSVQEFFQKNDPDQIDILVNNAGLAKGTSRAQESDFQDWQKMIDTNITALMYVTLKVLPSLVKKPGRQILNLGSVAGKWVYPGGSVYCASKAAVRFFSEGLRMDLLGTGVRVTNLEPGMVETEFSVVRTGSQKLADRIYEGMTPLTALDVAETLVWCAERPSHVNIAELAIFPADQAGVGGHLIHRNRTVKEKKGKTQ